MSEPIKRYHETWDGCEESPDGDYVKYADHAARIAEESARYIGLIAERDAAVARAERFRGALLEIALCLCNALKDPERARARRELGIKAPDAPCGLCGPCRAAEALAAESDATERKT